MKRLLLEALELDYPYSRWTIARQIALAVFCAALLLFIVWIGAAWLFTLAPR